MLSEMCVIHFDRNQPDVSSLPVETHFARGVLIDVSPHAAADPDYRLTPAEIAHWEREHGPIPIGAVVLLHTGWGAFWNNYSRYANQEVQGRMHFPGYSAKAARLLIHERKAKGLGIDTLNIDDGLSRDFKREDELFGEQDAIEFDLGFTPPLPERSRRYSGVF